MATNALVHTTSGEPGQCFEVCVRTDEQGVRTEVRTKRPRLPHAVPHVIKAHPWEEGGRGLFLVEQLADTWGTLAPLAEGVFFELCWHTSPTVIPIRSG